MCTYITLNIYVYDVNKIYIIVKRYRITRRRRLGPLSSPSPINGQIGFYSPQVLHGAQTIILIITILYVPYICAYALTSQHNIHTMAGILRTC